LDHPYGLSGRHGASSVIGSAAGVPYTAAVDEKTRRLTPCARMARTSVVVPVTLLSK
jgi:hypothetical protein